MQTDIKALTVAQEFLNAQMGITRIFVVGSPTSITAPFAMRSARAGNSAAHASKGPRGAIALTGRHEAMSGDEEREAALDALEKAMLRATLAERERCPICGHWLDDHGGKWCSCPTCGKRYEPVHGCKSGDYAPFG
jgi:hypothetical protein